LKVYKSISSKKVIQPLFFKETSQKIYSFEGFVYYCYNHWLEACEVFGTAEFFRFISEVLIHDNLQTEINQALKLNNINSFKLLKLLELSGFFKDEELRILEKEMKEWEEKPLYLRFKLRGDDAFRHKKYVKALELYKQAQVHEFDPIVEHNMGVTYLQLHFFQEAEECLISALEACDKIEIHLNIIKLLKMTNREELALEKIRRLLKNNFNADLLFERGLIYQMKNDFNKALDAFSNAYKLDNRDDILIKIIEMTIEINPSNPILEEIVDLQERRQEDYFMLKSKWYLRLNKKTEAIEVLESAVIHCEDNTKLYLQLAKLYRQNRQIIKAIGAITQAARNEALQDEILYEMALIAKRAGNRLDYEAKIDELIKLWKDDVRQRFAE